MTSSTTYTIESAQGIFPGTQIANAVPATTEAFDKLSVDDQLALLWFAYTEMGVSITRAATGAAQCEGSFSCCPGLLQGLPAPKGSAGGLQLRAASYMH